MAAATIDTMAVPEMSNEPRWPEWSAKALALGVNSSLAIGLPVHESVSGALNVYAVEPRAFDEDATILARSFAGYAAVALANAHLYEAAATLTQHLQAAMASRAVIEQAKGILMGERRCSAEEAFRILTRLSQDTNRKVRDVAAALVTRAGDSPKHE
jgi:GAF domain-containing protein